MAVRTTYRFTLDIERDEPDHVAQLREQNLATFRSEVVGELVNLGGRIGGGSRAFRLDDLVEVLAEHLGLNVNRGMAPEAAPSVAEEPGGGDAPGPSWRPSADDYWADAEDRGQHEHWKIDALLTLWRWCHAPADCTLNLRPFDRAAVGEGLRPVGPVFPVDQDLAGACRRLGFLRLFTAALGLTPEQAAVDLTTVHPIGCWQPMAVAKAMGVETSGGASAWIDVRSLLSCFHRAAEAALEVELAAVEARNAATRESWNELSNGPLRCDPPEVWRSLRTLGPLDGTTVERPPSAARGELQSVVLELAACPPLQPLVLSSSAPAWTGTPRTAAPIVPDAAASAPATPPS